MDTNSDCVDCVYLKRKYHPIFFTDLNVNSDNSIVFRFLKHVNRETSRSPTHRWPSAARPVELMAPKNNRDRYRELIITMWVIPNWSPITAPLPRPIERGNNGEGGGDDDSRLLAGCQLARVFNMVGIYGCNPRAHVHRSSPAKSFVLGAVGSTDVRLPTSGLLGDPPPHDQAKPFAHLAMRYWRAAPFTSLSFRKRKKVKNRSANRSRAHTGVCSTNKHISLFKPSGSPVCGSSQRLVFSRPPFSIPGN